MTVLWPSPTSPELFPGWLRAWGRCILLSLLAFPVAWLLTRGNIHSGGPAAFLLLPAGCLSVTAFLWVPLAWIIIWRGYRDGDKPTRREWIHTVIVTLYVVAIVWAANAEGNL